MSSAEFDSYAASYADDLARGLELTGESKAYFSARRLEWLAARLRRLGAVPGRAVDFGCGLGDATPGLLDIVGATAVTGVDPSAAILAPARERFGGRATFVTLDEFRPDGSHGLAYANGVFHHIPVAERAAAVRTVRDALVPGGWFALWENNPFNPGTRWIMRRVTFDRDAIMLTAGETRQLLEANGFQVAAVDFLFIFPRALRWFRRIEPILARFPLGGQYLVLARRR